MGRLWLEPRRVLMLSSMVTVITMIMISWVYVLGKSLVVDQAPLVDAAMEIKLEATTAHLWLEEAVSGDHKQSINDVWTHLERADWYVHAMLEGGESQEGVFLPLEEENERRMINDVRLSLSKFRKIAEERYGMTQHNLPGSELDEEFDKIFNQFISKADQVESMVQARISEQLLTYRTWFVFVFIGTSALFIYSTIVLYKSSVTNRGLMGELKDKNFELDYKAHFDHLTGLPNRVLFYDRLSQQILSSKRKNDLFAVFFIDLDNFKSINDEFGHQAGDQVLVETARRISSCVRENDIATRVSGDEFIVIAHTLENESVAFKVAEGIACKLLEKIVAPIKVNDYQISITISIGISFYPIDANDSEKLVFFADSAMYEAKSRGKNSYRFYSSAIDPKVS